MIFRRTLLAMAIGLWGVVWLHTPSLTLPALVLVLIGIPAFMILKHVVLPALVFVSTPAVLAVRYVNNRIGFDLFWIGVFWSLPVLLFACYYIDYGYTTLIQ